MPFLPSVRLLLNVFNCSKRNTYAKYTEVLSKVDDDIERNLDLIELIRRNRMFAMRMAFTKSAKK
jgi:hypothetical protein